MLGRFVAWTFRPSQRRFPHDPVSPHDPHIKSAIAITGGLLAIGAASKGSGWFLVLGILMVTSVTSLAVGRWWRRRHPAAVTEAESDRALEVAFRASWKQRESIRKADPDWAARLDVLMPLPVPKEIQAQRDREERKERRAAEMMARHRRGQPYVNRGNDVHDEAREPS